MDQSVTIDGQRVLLNGELVAEALGDFSVRVLAEAIVLHTQMQKELGDENGSFPALHWLQHAEAVVRIGVMPEEPTRATGLFDRGVRPGRKIVVDHATGRFNERCGLVPPENKNHRCSTLTGRIYANSGGGYQPTGPDLGGNPPSQDDYTPRPTPAPADLIIKAREYYPDNEGLLRMYADCRGYSCDQVAEAIDHAKRL